MSNTRTIMYEMFEESPGDLAAYGALADDLEEDGWYKLAHAFRWMFKRGMYPHKRTNYSTGTRNTPQVGRAVPQSCRWAWYRRALYPSDEFAPNVYPAAKRAIHGLPQLLLSSNQKTFATHQQAVMFLAEQLAKVGETYNCEPPGPRGIPLIDVLDTGGVRVPPPVPDPSIVTNAVNIDAKFWHDESLAGEDI